MRLSDNTDNNVKQNQGYNHVKIVWEYSAYLSCLPCLAKYECMLKDIKTTNIFSKR